MLSNARGKWVKTEAGRIQFAPFNIARNFWRRSFQFANFLPPPFAILGFSAVIFYGLRRYLDYDKISREPWGELYWQDLREVPRQCQHPLRNRDRAALCWRHSSPKPL